MDRGLDMRKPLSAVPVRAARRTANSRNRVVFSSANGTDAQPYGPNLRGRCVHFTANERNPQPMNGDTRD